MVGMERISGPDKEHFIAAYTVDTGHGHVGYAKICLRLPDNVWSVDPVERLTSVPAASTELEALIAVENKARLEIGQLVLGFRVSGPGPLVE